MKLRKTKLFYKQQLVRVGKRLCLSGLIFLTIPTAFVKAQVTPDGSLPTSVEQQGENRLNIDGGEREGNNLFHSFEEFSVTEGIEAVFENAPDIENIFTRITGNSVSNINGILRTQGGANFFLVNPNGIIFGENARLDIGGSFIATTGNSIQFEDGTEFASSAEEKPILTVSVPIGVQFDGNSGAITVNGTGNQIKPSFSSSPTEVISTMRLSVNAGSTLALIGGNINLDGGTINARGGRIELGSVGSGLVNFQASENGFTFDFNNINSYKKIDLANLSILNASSESKGEISLNAQVIDIRDASLLLIQNQGDIPSGTIDINATESLTLRGTSISLDNNISSGIFSETLNSGKGADINVLTENLVLEDGGRINASTFSNAEGGNLTINSTDSIHLLKNSSVDPNRNGFTVNGISAVTFSSGSAGNLLLSTSDLKITNGGSIQSSASGSGNGGNLTIDAETIEISGVNLISKTRSPSALAASANSGVAGNLNIKGSQLIVSDGGAISSSTYGTGVAGNIDLNISEIVEVRGENQDRSSRISASVVQLSEASRIRLNLPELPSGSGGNLTINTSLLKILQGGEIGVENIGKGNAGVLTIDVEKLNLGVQGSIIATTASGTGGNININTNQLQIDENSSISSTAEKNGDGGNVFINAATLIAKKNSEVTANAFAGRGGNLSIDADGLFLFDSSENIFSASSELGIDGTIQINTPYTTLQPELEQLELELFTTNEAIANSCLARNNKQSSFNISGGNEFPKNPDSNYSDANFSLTGMGSLPTTDKQPLSTQADNSQYEQATLPAEKMVETEDGRILLVAAPQQAKSFFCQDAEEK